MWLLLKLIKAKILTAEFFNLVGKNRSSWTMKVVLVFAAFNSQAQSIDVAASWARPPYVIPENHSGFELDVVKEVLTSLGHKVNFIYVPYDRTISMLKQEKVDMALTLNPKSGIEATLLGDPFVAYQNVALSLKDNKLNINTIADLSKSSLVAFQGAALVLGDEFAKAMTKNHLYLEMGDTPRMLELLLHGAVDAIIIDINIFTAIAKKNTGHDQLDKITIHPLFEINRYSAGFKDVKLKQSFNLALKQYVANGRYNILKKRYNIQEITPVGAAK